MSSHSSELARNAGSPRIHLAVDNCFASKRWTEPHEWISEIIKTGLRCIETSADTEMDPFYHGADYISGWIAAVRRAQEAAGARVVNLYSGHGTYSTLGLTHTDAGVRERILSQWLKPMVDTAHALEAGLGFFCHAFPQSVLADPERYEQEFLALAGNLARYAHLYAEPADSDPYQWLRALAGWSPIVHLQQTDGRTSAHQPFNEKTNRSGIIEAPKLHSAIDTHYRNATPDTAMPPRVSDIYLTIEVFAATAETPEQVRTKLRESVDYWRRYVPSDGQTVETLIRRM